MLGTVLSLDACHSNFGAGESGTRSDGLRGENIRYLA